MKNMTLAEFKAWLEDYLNEKLSAAKQNPGSYFRPQALEIIKEKLATVDDGEIGPPK
jgi:hypothetical protein